MAIPDTCHRGHKAEWREGGRDMWGRASVGKSPANIFLLSHLWEQHVNHTDLRSIHTVMIFGLCLECFEYQISVIYLVDVNLSCLQCLNLGLIPRTYLLNWQSIMLRRWSVRLCEVFRGLCETGAMLMIPHRTLSTTSVSSLTRYHSDWLSCKVLLCCSRRDRRC